MLRAFILLLCLWATPSFSGNDIYDPHTGILTIPSLQIGEAFYANTRLQLSPSGQWSVLGVGASNIAAPATYRQVSSNTYPLSTTVPNWTAPGTGEMFQLDNGQWWIAQDDGCRNYITSGSLGVVIELLPDGRYRMRLASSSASCIITQYSAAASANPLAVLPATIAANIGDQLTLSIAGGTPSYSVVSSSSNASVTRVTQTSGSAAATAVITAANQGTAMIVVTDSAGNQVSSTLTIATSSIPLALTPASISTSVGNRTTATISGGRPPYSVVSSSANVSVVQTIPGAHSTTLILEALGVGDASIMIFDSTGGQVNGQVSVTTQALVVTPSSVSVRTGTNVSINISGGLPPYSVNSSNTHVARLDSVAQHPTLASADIKLYTIGEGASTIMISDSSGRQASMTITTTR